MVAPGSTPRVFYEGRTKRRRGRGRGRKTGQGCWWVVFTGPHLPLIQASESNCKVTLPAIMPTSLWTQWQLRVRDCLAHDLTALGGWGELQDPSEQRAAPARAQSDRNSPEAEQPGVSWNTKEPEPYRTIFPGGRQQGNICQPPATQARTTADTRSHGSGCLPAARSRIQAVGGRAPPTHLHKPFIAAHSNPRLPRRKKPTAIASGFLVCRFSFSFLFFILMAGSSAEKSLPCSWQHRSYIFPPN